MLTHLHRLVEFYTDAAEINSHTETSGEGWSWETPTTVRKSQTPQQQTSAPADTDTVGSETGLKRTSSSSPLTSR